MAYEKLTKLQHSNFSFNTNWLNDIDFGDIYLYLSYISFLTCEAVIKKYYLPYEVIMGNETCNMYETLKDYINVINHYYHY